MAEEYYKKGKVITWAARAGLMGIAGVGVVGLLAPEVRPTEISVAPDQVSHALFVYATTLFAALSFPRVNIWLIAVLFSSAAVAVEVAQLTKVLKGAAQTGDLAADFVGVLAAVVPLGVVRARRAARVSGG